MDLYLLVAVSDIFGVQVVDDSVRVSFPFFCVGLMTDAVQLHLLHSSYLVSSRSVPKCAFYVHISDSFPQTDATPFSENPFEYDENDLDLDHFCRQISRELYEITAHSSPSPETYLYSAWNQPFAPADRRTAETMKDDEEHEYHQQGPGVGMDSIRRTLLKSWRDVDRITRKEHHHELPMGKL